MEKMVETLYDHAFTTHTYKHTTMGFLKDIENMPNEMAYSRQFFDRFYRPENVVLLVVGDADPEDGLQAGRGELRRLEGGRPAPGHPGRAAAEEGAARRADLAGPDAADAGRGVPHARLLDDERRPADAGRAGRAAVRRARAALQEAGDHRAEGRVAVGLERRPRRSQPVHRVRAHQEAGRPRLRREGDPRRDGAHRARRASTTGRCATSSRTSSTPSPASSRRPTRRPTPPRRSSR